MKSIFLASLMLSVSAVCAPMAFLPLNTAPVSTASASASAQKTASLNAQTSRPVQASRASQTSEAVQTTAVSDASAPSVDRSVSIGVEQDGKLVAMTLEDYLCATVAAEMPASFPSAALEAQAIAARTLVLHRLSDSSLHPSGALVCTDFHHCAAFCDFSTLSEASAEAVLNAVRATDGQVLLYDGEPITAAFHAISGGMTEASEDVWGGKLPYLTNVESPGEESAPNYRTEKTFSAAEFSAAVSKAYPKVDLSSPCSRWFSDSERSAAGGILSVEVGGVRVTGTALRSLLGLASTDFTVKADDTAKTLTFTCTGHGHGVDMSQYGAAYLAENGLTAGEITAHYYPGTVIASGISLWNSSAD